MLLVFICLLLFFGLVFFVLVCLFVAFFVVCFCIVFMLVLLFYVPFICLLLFCLLIFCVLFCLLFVCFSLFFFFDFFYVLLCLFIFCFFYWFVLCVFVVLYLYVCSSFVACLLSFLFTRPTRRSGGCSWTATRLDSFVFVFVYLCLFLFVVLCFSLFVCLFAQTKTTRIISDSKTKDATTKRHKAGKKQNMETYETQSSIMLAGKAKSVKQKQNNKRKRGLEGRAA